MAIAVKTENVVKNYRLGQNKIEVLRGVDLIVEEGSWTAILGASGSGKTTLLNILGGLERPDSGAVEIFGEKINDYTKRQLDNYRCKKVGIIFQAYHLIPELSALENVLLPGLISGTEFSKSKERAVELLDAVGLSHRIKHKAMQLSGGEQQRVAIARALINSPSILLADEPTGNLDSQTGREVLETIRKIRSGGVIKTIIMVTHDRDVAGMSDYIINLRDGRIIHS